MTSEQEISILPLYKRDSDRDYIPRVAFGMSFVNTLYWLWYAIDFIPAVNASPIESLHIDPIVGYGALGLGIGINVMTAIYPAVLVAKMDFDETNNQLHVYRYNLPFITVVSTPALYNLGDIKSSDLTKILEDYKGDFRRFKGHLALKAKGSTLPLLLEITDADRDVENGGEDLMHMILRPKAFLSSRRQDRLKTLRVKAPSSKRRIK